MTIEGLPVDVEWVRTTATFDEGTVPRGLLREHRVARDTWGRLVVATGQLRFVFDERHDGGRVVDAGASQVIPPDVVHHVEIIGPVQFAVEFYAVPDHREPNGDEANTVIA